MSLSRRLTVSLSQQSAEMKCNQLSGLYVRHWRLPIIFFLTILAGVAYSEYSPVSSTDDIEVSVLQPGIRNAGSGHIEEIFSPVLGVSSFHSDSDSDELFPLARALHAPVGGAMTCDAFPFGSGFTVSNSPAS